MKKVHLLFWGVTLFFAACNKAVSDDTQITQPVVQIATIGDAQLLCNADLTWLKEIIKKADEDKATKKYGGQYFGYIWIYTYKSEPTFFIEMLMGSSMLYGHVYNCSGSAVYISSADVSTWYTDVRTNGKLVYKNMP